MKKKKGYKLGGVVGTTEYAQSAYKNGGIAKKKYQDGGIVESKGSTMSEKENESKGASSAKRNALKGLKETMVSMGGNSLFNSLDSSKEAKYEDGGIVESQEEESSEEAVSAYDDLSKEELIKLLNNK